MLLTIHHVARAAAFASPWGLTRDVSGQWQLVGPGRWGLRAAAPGREISKRCLAAARGKLFLGGALGVSGSGQAGGRRGLLMFSVHPERRGGGGISSRPSGGAPREISPCSSHPALVSIVKHLGLTA